MAQYINVSTAHGPMKFAYWVDTPSGSSTIDPSIPTILFLHSLWVPGFSWREQFSRPQFRRFNCVAVDLMDHGWTETEVPETYSQEDAAADVAAWMDAMALPPVFICALSSGSTTAIQLAVTEPKRVLGMFLFSHMGTEETEHAGTARQEIVDTWKEAMANPSGEIDEEALEHAISGIFQLSLTGQIKPVSLIMAFLTRKLCVERWGHKRLRELQVVCCDFDVKRHGHSTEVLATSLRNIPIALLHGSGDFAYDAEYYDRFAQQLREANIPVETHAFDGAPHNLHVSHQDEFAELAGEFFARHCPNPNTWHQQLKPWRGSCRRSLTRYST
ncbi:alpha/beta-hydrolase [Auriculariales sp. MPI-PUGE-AT-0066]|nr:alpha/beta-hydrolase [Auriculariales sp. MPI-PUGE-AT-0066]